MTEFDQLIREKAEQAQYPYKPSAWKNFAQRAGIKTGMSAWQIAVVAIASVVVIGGITWTIFKRTVSQPVAEPEPVEVVEAQDTVKTLSDEDAQPAPAVEPTLNADKQVRPKTSQTPIVEPKNVEPAQLAKPAVKKPKVVKRKLYGRPVILGADTITQMVPSDEELRKGNSRIF